MKSKIAIIVCGNSGIDYIKHDYPIDVFRSILYLDNNEYIDFIDITAQEFYQQIGKNPNVDLKTSQTATGVMFEVYKRLEKEGYTDVIVITISSFLSGTYQNAVLAGEMVKYIKVHVFDSLLVSYPEAKMALVASQMAKDGCSVDEIIAKLSFMRDNTRLYFSVDTLKFLVKNGRLSVAAGVLGGLLKIKPMLWVTPEGKIETLEKIRTSKKAIERIKTRFIEETKDENVDAFIIYTNNLTMVEKLAKQIKASCPKIKKITMLPLTPVVGAHAGPGSFALGYIKESD